MPSASDERKRDHSLRPFFGRKSTSAASSRHGSYADGAEGRDEARPTAVPRDVTEERQGEVQGVIETHLPVADELGRLPALDRAQHVRRQLLRHEEAQDVLPPLPAHVVSVRRQQVQRGGGAELAHGGAIARVVTAHDLRARGSRAADVHEADGLLRSAAVGAGHAGDARGRSRRA